jgi:K(+)-stimulated pyrophosphate-energized sodium pump
MITHVLAAVFFIVSMFFVYRSFYGMRIGSEKAKVEASEVRAGQVDLP